MTTATTPSVPMTPTITTVALLQRERARSAIRSVFPRRRVRMLVARTSDDFGELFRTTLVDAAIVDVGGASEDTWRAASLVHEFPSVPFFGLAPLRAADGPALAHCATLDFADLLVDGVDDAVTRDLVLRQMFSSRFADALRDPPGALGLTTALQRGAWRAIVEHAGRPVRTVTLASALHVTREHLSRSFAAQGGPNLKRVIDLVRLIAAAELAKNPGYDIRDVARVLDFASSSHLSTTAQRIVGTKPASLARLRTVDLIERFVRGHGRSRG